MMGQQILAEPILKKVIAASLEGGHTYTILEEDAFVYEFETGP